MKLTSEEIRKALRDTINNAIEDVVRRQIERLEREGAEWLKKGYEPRELTIVQYDNGYQEVKPSHMVHGLPREVGQRMTEDLPNTLP